MLRPPARAAPCGSGSGRANAHHTSPIRLISTTSSATRRWPRSMRSRRTPTSRSRLPQDEDSEAEHVGAPSAGEPRASRSSRKADRSLMNAVTEGCGQHRMPRPSAAFSSSVGHQALRHTKQVIRSGTACPGSPTAGAWAASAGSPPRCATICTGRNGCSRRSREGQAGRCTRARWTRCSSPARPARGRA